MENIVLNEISKKLNALISVSLRNLTGDANFGVSDKRKQGVGDVTRYLANFGLDAKDIAEITGAPVGSIRTLLTPKRRK